MGGGNLMPALGGTHAPPLEGLGLALASWANASSENDSPNDAAAYVEFFRDGVLRFSGNVQRDRVTSLKRRQCSKHVYNLESPAQLYIGNGLFVHNCRCTMGVSFETPDPQNGTGS
jgi:hypothetical protein